MSHSGDSQSCPISSQARQLFSGSTKKQPASTCQSNLEDSGANLVASGSNGLSTDRVSSSIPRSDTNENWLYPSPQMFFNSMLRKGHSPMEHDMPVIVPIHNMVNEQVWQEILQYERLHIKEYGDEQPKLLRFEGKAEDLSPKARILSFLGYVQPFDRHDWFIDRNGQIIRYVIDFYQGKQSQNSLLSIHIDVRPAISLQGIKDRLRMGWKETASKLANSFSSK